MLLTEEILANFIRNVYWIVGLILLMKAGTEFTEAGIEELTTKKIKILKPKKENLILIGGFIIAIFTLMKGVGMVDIIFTTASPIVKYVIILTMSVGVILVANYYVISKKTTIPIAMYSIQIILVSIFGYYTGEIARKWGITPLQDALLFSFFSFLVFLILLKSLLRVKRLKFDATSYLQKIIEKRENTSKTSSDYKKLGKEIKRLRIGLYIGKIIYLISIVSIIIILSYSVWTGVIFTNRIFLIVFFGLWYFLKYANLTRDFPPKSIFSFISSAFFFYLLIHILWDIITLTTLDNILFLIMVMVFGLWYGHWNNLLINDYPLLKDYNFSKYLSILNGMGYGKFLNFMGIGILLVILTTITLPQLLVKYEKFFFLIIFGSYSLGFFFIIYAISFFIAFNKWMKKFIEKEIKKTK